MDDTRTIVIIIMDGLGDRPSSEHKGETPLSAGKTPNLDRLAEAGQSGLMNVVGPGIIPGSDTGHLSLFSYDPHEYYTGRGPFEAMGAGLSLKHGDVAFRANFGTVDSNLIVTDRRAGRVFTKEESSSLQKVIDGLKIEDVSVHFISTVEHRGALVLEGEGLSEKITDVDPHMAGEKLAESKPLVPKAEKTARIVNQLVRTVLDSLKEHEVNKAREERGLPQANALLLRGAGQFHTVPSLKERFGIKSAVLAGGALYIGVGKHIGMEYIEVDGQTGRYDTNFTNVANKTIECVESDYDLVFTHIKATDNAGHDSRFDLKKKVIENTDTMIGKIVDAVQDKIVLAVTGDHSTPVTVAEHTSDPVPLLLWSQFIRPDEVMHFSEFEAAKGALHTIRGLDLLPILLGYAGLSEKYGS
jgi:2,3-bisphosphoglycerate-independent phosphoglycerate mutase